MTQQTTKGRLFLVPTPLDFGCATEAPLLSDTVYLPGT